MVTKRVALAAIALLATAAIPGAYAEATEHVPLRFSFEQGADNIPPGCQAFQVLEEEDPRDPNPCHAIATSMNGLDTPKIDVLLIVPASPYAERDIRVLRQSTQMWEDGIQWMAADMGLSWLADTVEFRITTQVIDDTAAGGFTEYAIADPEIVLIASNPVGGIGIGFDPQYLAGEIFGNEEISEGPCHGIKNPFQMEAWQALPGFDNHHGDDSGTYVEDCDGAGGNICFSVNAAIDPDPTGTAPTLIDFGLYDLASHETGHCLTLGHVGDGAEGEWATVPTNDIMAYDSDPPGKVKCVSSLDVEAFAVIMSHYIDTNGDDVVDEADIWWANDAEGEGDGRPFMIQHPDNHYYASPTREAIDCPQPDLSPMPLAETLNFTPEAPMRAALAIHHTLDWQAIGPGALRLQGSITGEPQNATGDYRVLLNTGGQNITATLREGAWEAIIDLGDAPEGPVVINATWMAGDVLVDSDRAAFVIDPNAKPIAGSSEDAPGVGPLAVLLGVAALALVRRRA